MTDARKTKLVDCNPQWVESHGVPCGVSFDCPEGHDGCRHTIRFTPMLDGTSWTPHGKAIWQRTGDAFDTLTVTPSIRRVPRRGGEDTPDSSNYVNQRVNETIRCALHVTLTNGTFEFCGDSR